MIYEFQHFGISESFSKEYKENFSYPVHLHESFEFVTILSGKMTIVVDNIPYELTKGDAVFIFPNQLHTFISEESSHLLCIFSSQLINVYHRSYSDKCPESNKFTPSAHLINMLKDIREDSSVYEKKAFLYSLCSEFDKTATYKQAYDENGLLHKIFMFAESHYEEDCTLGDLEKSIGYSYSYLSRYFKNIIGMSFNEYVNQYRISKACYLLTSTDLPVLECAYEVGYRSLRSFNRNFKIYTGVTPYQYRKNAV